MLFGSIPRITAASFRFPPVSSTCPHPKAARVSRSARPYLKAPRPTKAKLASRLLGSLRTRRSGRGLGSLRTVTLRRSHHHLVETSKPRPGDRRAGQVRSYLLSHSHPIGRHKAVFLESLGYRRDSWQILDVDLRQRHASADVQRIVASTFGSKYMIRASSPWWKSVGSRAGVFGAQARNEERNDALSS